MSTVASHKLADTNAENARKERLAEHQSETYVELIKFAHWFGRYVQAQVHNAQMTPPLPTDPGPAQEDRDVLSAQVATYGSRRMQELLVRLLKAAKAVGTAFQRLEAAQAARAAGRTGDPIKPFFEILNEAAAEVDAAINAVRNQVRRELHDEQIDDNWVAYDV